jgi:hypothetical protein
MSLSSDGKRIAVYTRTVGDLRLCETMTGKVIKAILKRYMGLEGDERDTVRDFLFSPDGKTLAIVDLDVARDTGGLPGELADIGSGAADGCSQRTLSRKTVRPLSQYRQLFDSVGCV